MRNEVSRSRPLSANDVVWVHDQRKASELLNLDTFQIAPSPSSKKAHTWEKIEPKKNDMLRPCRPVYHKDRPHRRVRSAEQDRTRRVLPEASSNRIMRWVGKAPTPGDQDKLRMESHTVHSAYDNILREEADLNQNIDDILKTEQRLEAQKRQNLVKRWIDNVYIPLKMELDNTLKSKEGSIEQKCRIYEDYINYINEKGVVFLDTVSPDEYDPFQNASQRKEMDREYLASRSVHSKSARSTTYNRLTLPCISNKKIPRAQLDQPPTPRVHLKPAGRQGTECNTWLSMKLYDIQSDIRKRSQLKVTGLTNATSADLWMNTPVCVQDDMSTRTMRKRQYKEKYSTELILV